MKKVAKLTESELVELIKRIVNESFEDDDIVDTDDIDDDSEEIQDFGFDYEDVEDDTDYIKPKSKKKSMQVDFQYGGPEWKKEWEKPYNPIKPTDLPLDKFLKMRRKKD